jgi:opacity protein-like surface antigen
VVNILFQFSTFFVVLMQQFQSVTFLPFSRLSRTTSQRQIVLIKRDGLYNEVSNMNILKSILLAGVVALPLSVAAQAADADPSVPSEVSTTTGFYVRGDLGASFLQWSGGADDHAWVGGGGVGYQYNDNWRMDLTLDHTGQYSIAPGAKIDTTSVMGNVYFDWKNDTAFTPYIGAGLGYGWVKGPGFTDDKGLALGLAAGVSADVMSNLAVDVGYKFRDIGISGPDTQEHMVTAGLRFKF